MSEEQSIQNETISKKNKKINQFSMDELNQKIEEMGKANQTKSRYYKHLLERRDELQA